LTHQRSSEYEIKEDKLCENVENCDRTLDVTYSHAYIDEFNG